MYSCKAGRFATRSQRVAAAHKRRTNRKKHATKQQEGVRLAAQAHTLERGIANWKKLTDRLSREDEVGPSAA